MAQDCCHPITFGACASYWCNLFDACCVIIAIVQEPSKPLRPAGSSCTGGAAQWISRFRIVLNAGNLRITLRVYRQQCAQLYAKPNCFTDLPRIHNYRLRSANTLRSERNFQKCSTDCNRTAPNTAVNQRSLRSLRASLGAWRRRVTSCPPLLDGPRA